MNQASSRASGVATGQMNGQLSLTLGNEIKRAAFGVDHGRKRFRQDLSNELHPFRHATGRYGITDLGHAARGTYQSGHWSFLRSVIGVQCDSF